MPVCVFACACYALHRHMHASPGAGLQDMLKTVAYQKEIIYTHYGGETAIWAEQVLQLWAELRSMGFGHFVIMARLEQTCVEVDST